MKGHLSRILLAFALLLTPLGGAETPPADPPKAEAATTPTPDWDKIDFEQLIAELDKATPGAVAAALKRFPDTSSFGADHNLATRIFAAACRAASPEELNLLHHLLQSELQNNSTATYEFAAYTQARLRQQVAKAKSERTKITLPPPTAAAPEFIAQDPELRRTWTAWHQAIDPYYTMLDRATAANRAENAQPPAKAEETLRKVLAEPKPELIRTLVLHLGNEGVGFSQRETTQFPASQGLLWMTTQPALTPECLGAAFRLVSGRQALGAPPKPGALRETICDLLGVAGLDWEEVFAGSMLPDGAAPLARRLTVVVDDMSAWQALAARGSPRGVQLGLAVIRKSKLDIVRSMDFIRTALRTSSEEIPTNIDRARLTRGLPSRMEPLPPEVRDEVLNTLREFLSPERTPTELTQSLRLLPKELQTTMADPLKKLMHHPSYPIAQQARAMLVALKLVEESAEITAPPPPLRVRVMVDDAPLASARVRATTNFRTVSLSTDADGWVKVPLDQELDLAKLRKVTITSELNEVPTNEWSGPWVEVSVPVDGKVDQEFTATATTASLEVDIDPTSEFQLSKPARIILTRNLEIPWRQQDRLNMPLQDSVTFNRLQRGTYHFEVQADGAARYQSKPVVLGKNGSIRLVRLEPGRNVRVKIQAADSVMHLGRARLFRNGEAYPMTPNNEYNGWDGLPYGKYEMRLDPWPGKLQALFLGVDGVPKNGYDGITQTFEIKADSPPTVDLGTLTLKAKE